MGPMRYDMSSAANTVADQWLYDIINDEGEDNKKYYLYLFEGGKERELVLQGVFDTEETCLKRASEIARGILGRNPDYWRSWVEEGGTVYDFGSWTFFFKVSRK